MFPYIARISLVSKCGTGTVILADVMIGPPDLGVREAVQIRRDGNPSLAFMTKRLTAERVYSQSCFALRAVRLA